MIDVSEVVADVDLQAPQPFTILRSIQAGFVPGGFADQKIMISDCGPVQPATDLDAQMVPEADRLSQMFSFWATQPIYTTRGKASVLTTHGEIPQGSGTVFVLSEVPPENGIINLFYNGLLLEPSMYVLSGQTITLTFTSVHELYASWPVIQQVGLNAADIIVYPPAPYGQQYRILATKHYPGSGYFKAIGTRMNAT